MLRQALVVGAGPRAIAPSRPGPRQIASVHVSRIGWPRSSAATPRWTYGSSPLDSSPASRPLRIAFATRCSVWSGGSLLHLSHRRALCVSTRLRAPSQHPLSPTPAPQPPAPASAEAPDAATSTPPSSPPLLKRLGPYIALARLDRPIGTWLLYLPCAFSLTLAAQHAHLAPTTLAANLALFGVGAVVMRGAGCTINDLWDRDLDARVERTRSRPLASGLVSVPQAVGFLGVQLSVGLAVLLCLNIESIMLGAASLLVVGVYPLMKRITYWPQFILGIAFNWGALLGPVALTSTLLPSISLPLYASTVSWTLLYDTVYAHQDKRDDVRAGIRSSALRLGETWSRPALAVFGAVFVAGTLLAASEAVRFGGAESGTRDGPSKTRDNAGAHDDDGTATWWLGLPSKWDVSLAPWDETRRALLEDHAGVAAACALAALHVAWQVTTVRLHVPADCWRKFVSNRDVGLVVWAGMAYDYVVAWRRRRRVEVDE